MLTRAHARLTPRSRSSAAGRSRTPRDAAVCDRCVAAGGVWGDGGAVTALDRVFARPADAIKDLVTALRAHGTRRELAVASCRLLHELCFRAESQDALLQCGAVSAVVEAMRNHPADAEVANDGCGVLCYCVLEAEDVVRESAPTRGSRGFLNQSTPLSCSRCLR